MELQQKLMIAIVSFAWRMKRIQLLKINYIYLNLFRAHNTGNIPGTGLGLNIASTLYRINEWFRILCNLINEGTSFTLTFSSIWAKVLVIEDNNEIRENIVEILDLADYEVFVAKWRRRGW
jgi:hypothetical protein